MEKKTQVTLTPGMALASICIGFIIHFILWIMIILNSYVMPMPGRVALVIFILIDFFEISAAMYDRFSKFLNSNK